MKTYYLVNKKMKEEVEKFQSEWALLHEEIEERLDAFCEGKGSAAQMVKTETMNHVPEEVYVPKELYSQCIGFSDEAGKFFYIDEIGEETLSDDFMGKILGLDDLQKALQNPELCIQDEDGVDMPEPHFVMMFG